MRKVLLSTVLVLLPASIGLAQGGYIHGDGDPRTMTPTPNCGVSRLYIDDSTAKLYISAQGSPCVWKDADESGVGGIISVFGRNTPDIVAATGDYTAAQVTNAADLSSATQQTFLGAIKTPAFTLGARLASTLSGDGQSIIVQADNGQIPIVPGHVLSWITDTSGGGHGAGDSGLDATTVCTSSNGKCASPPTGNGFAVVANGAFSSAARTLVAGDIPNLTQYQPTGNYFSFATGGVTANHLPRTISGLGNQQDSTLIDDGAKVSTTLPFLASRYSTVTNCVSAASPAVCGASTTGKVQVAAAATSLTINTSTVTALTGCWFTYDVTGITAPQNIALMVPPYISSRVVGTSMTITLPVAPVTSAANLQFGCIN